MKINYNKIGFKAGLEIHQQLSTNKLFCSCPSLLRKEKPDFKVERNLRARPGESGKIDKAAAHAQEKGLFYVYEGYDDTTCLVELDEQPPKNVNSKAFETALIVAAALHCTFPDYVQVMRKTVVDGSNTSGFQRTMLIGTNGYLEVNGDKIGIESVCLEEDAARRTSETKKNVTYRLDRLGIPLIEIATAPDIKNSDQAKKVAKEIGMLLRATGKAMRGIGTIRQDVNVSIKGHPRVELKGFQDLKNMPKTIDNEILRQQKEKNPDSHVRNVKADCSSKYLRPMPGAARMYPETDHPFIELNKTLISQAKKQIPEKPEKKLRKYEKITTPGLASKILFSEYENLFNKLTAKYTKTKPIFIAETIFSTTKEAVKKANQKSGKFTESQIESVLDLFENQKITKESVLNVFIEIAKGKSIKKAAEKFKPMDTSNLEAEIKKVISKNKDAPEGKLKGIVIGTLKSKAPVPKIIQIFEKLKK